MTPEDCNRHVLGAALSMLPGCMDSVDARRMLLAIGLQESRLEFRRQHGNGPARGLWQFELGGGVTGVLEHAATRGPANEACIFRHVSPWPRGVWLALEDDDILAAAFARLLLFSDPHPLPQEEQEGWRYYLRTWRPGKPHPETWPDAWAAANEVFA